MSQRLLQLRYTPLLLCLLLFVVLSIRIVDAQHDQRYYDTGAPQYTDIWVDPLHGDDSADGLSPATAVQHLSTAWARIPDTQPLTQTGYRLLLQPGSYDALQIPNEFTARTGTPQYPIEIVAAIPNTVTFTQPINLAHVAYVYIRDISVVVTSTPALSCTDCHHLLITASRFDGGGVVIAQSHHIYIEESVVHASDTTGITLRAVYESHIQQTRVTQSTEACIQLQSGSASIRIETNTLTACGTYGVVTGPHSTLESMRSPWIHYEAYDITVANNIIIATTDAGIGIYGAYNTLVAFNTLYDIGGRNTALAVGHAQRTCAGIISQGTPSCSTQLARRGWGTSNQASSGEAIPNRNVFIYNNLIVNPQTTLNQAHLAVAPAVTPGIYSGIPAPSRADENLRIVGNIFWNGDTTLPLGIEINSGCMVTNPACNTTQLRADNRINTTAVIFVDPVNNNVRLQQGVPSAVSIPSFPDNRPLIPLAPLALPSNAITRDFLNMRRGSDGFPGAYSALIDSATITPPDDVPSSTPTHTPAHNTPTSSRTRTYTRTRSWTRTMSVTHTSSVTVTTSRTRTISPTHTPSSTRSTETASRTQTASRTATASHTASSTPTPSSTKTVSSTRTSSQTSTPSTTRSTPTASRTLTASRTATASHTASSTPTPSNTYSPSVTHTPSHTRTATATATITKTRTATLTRTASRTRTASATYTVTLTSTPVERVPIIPRITSTDKAYLREILQRGIARRNNPRVFAKIGDSITASTNFLQDIGCNGENLANYHSLYETVAYFRQHTFMETYGTGWCNVSNSFNALSPSAQPGWSAYYALFSDFLMMRYQASCREPFNTPIACELRLKRPSIALIMFGSNDVTYGNISDFENSYTHVVDYTLEQGVIPVLSTIPPRLDNPVYNERVVRYNAVIIRMAATKRLPLWNYWLALQSPELINNGLAVDRIHPNTYRMTQSADFSQEGLRYGYNQRNLTALQVLDALRRIVILNGPPDQ